MARTAKYKQMCVLLFYVQTKVIYKSDIVCKQVMTDPKGNIEFCGPEARRTLRVKVKQSSLFPMVLGPRVVLLLLGPSRMTRKKTAGKNDRAKSRGREAREAKGGTTTSSASARRTI